MAIISLVYASTAPNAGTALVPSDHLTGWDYRQAHAATTVSDIFGVPVVVGLEHAYSDAAWDVVVHYVSLEITNAVLAAYINNYALVATDELAVATQVVIKEYPSIERNKVVSGEVVYTLKFCLQASSLSSTLAELTTPGPRLFGR